MRIWVDADACPNPVKEVIFKAADRREIETTLVANQLIRTAKSRWLRAVQVPSGFDAADDWIVEEMSAGDLVITADIPLANDVVVKGGVAINPRGTEYTKENIKDHLSRRDMMEELRSSGSVSGGPPPFGKKEVQQFANAFDRQIARLS